MEDVLRKAIPGFPVSETNDLSQITLKLLLSPAVGFDSAVTEAPQAYRAVPRGDSAFEASLQGGIDSGE